MSQHVTTSFGQGVVVDTDTVRGKTSFKVEGANFSIWMTAAEVESATVPEFGQLEWSYNPDGLQDNSTALPYNPAPQFTPHSGESTIQPNQHLDSDKRLSPADSVTFAPASTADRFPNNFARTSSLHFAYSDLDGPIDRDEMKSMSDEELVSLLEALIAFQPDMDLFDIDHYDHAVENFKKAISVFDRRRGWIMPPSLDRYVRGAVEWARSELSKTSSRTAGSDQNGTADTWMDLDYPSEVTDPEHPGGTNTPEDEGMYASIADVQARLGDKYADIPVDIDHTSIQARLDDDPYRVVSDIKMANMEKAMARGFADPSSELRVAAALDLESTDPELRTAAWADVRAKATRLRRGGAVQLEAANPTAIVATVTGDHGIYDVAVLRGSAFTGNSAVTEWSCSCPWGDWAFERQATYVGRLCSHAYAALQELRSVNMRKNKPSEWKHAGREVTAAPEWSLWQQDSPLWLESASGEYAAEVHIYGDHYNGNLGTNDAGWSIHYFPDGNMSGEVVETNPPFATYGKVQDAQRDAQEALAKYDTATASREAAQYPNADGSLTTTRGTLTPDLHQIPQTHHHEIDDLQVGSPYPQPVTQDHERAASVHTSGYVDRFYNYVQGIGARSTDEWAVEDYVEYRNQAGEPLDDDELAELRDYGIKIGFLSEPFQGSGGFQRDEIGSSEQAEAGHHYEDVYGPADNPVMPNPGDPVLSSQHEAELPDNGLTPAGEDDPNEVDVTDPDDIVANFQKNAGHLLGGSEEPAGGQFDFAGAAQSFLRTAGRNFTMAEQQELIDEEAVGGALDRTGLDLKGTHYLP